MSVPVPAEHLGQADARVHNGLRRALTPLQRRLDRHPVLRPDLLIDAERAWRKGVPEFGRLAFSVEPDCHAPKFHELRCASGLYRAEIWNRFEPGCW